jgi:hypothetical protein
MQKRCNDSCSAFLLLSFHKTSRSSGRSRRAHFEALVAVDLLAQRILCLHSFPEPSMSLVIRDASPSEKRGNAMSAALAKEQLEYAVQIVREVLPQSAGDGALIGAVVQAIAMNYAAVPQPNR